MRLLLVGLFAMGWMGWIPAANATGIEGLWKNDNNPVLMEITLAENAVATGTVAQNEQNPAAVGRVVLKDLVADSADAGVWRGQVFAARLDEFRDAEVRVNGQQLEINVKVGFMSRTVSWSRVVVEPAPDESVDILN